MEILDLDVDDGLRWSTGFRMLDAELGGGSPRGICEVFGNESTGKSALVMQWAGHVLEQGGYVQWFDQEDSFDRPRFEALANISLDPYYSHDTSSAFFIPARADTLEELLQEVASRSKTWRGQCAGYDTPIMFVLDSLAQTETAAESKRAFDKQEFASIPQTLSRNLKKIATACHKYKFMFVVINQVREKVGVMFGDKNTTPGGRAIKFAALLRLQLQNLKTEPDGLTVKVTTKKNKVFLPARTLVMPFKYETGFSDFDAAIHWLKSAKLCTQTAKTYNITTAKGLIKFPKEMRVEHRDKVIDYAVKRYSAFGCRIP